MLFALFNLNRNNNNIDNFVGADELALKHACPYVSTLVFVAFQFHTLTPCIAKYVVEYCWKYIVTM